MRVDDDTGPILIAGGGIGGLSAAVALGRLGYRVHVFERAPGYEEAGAGLTLTPPGLRALDALGLLAPVLAASDNVSRTAFLDHASGDLLRLSASTAPDEAAAATDDTRVMHRSDLHAILLEGARAAGARVEGGREMRSLTQGDDGVRLEFADGAPALGSLLIGCDGLRSIARRLLHGEDALRHIGLVAWRAMIPAERVDDLLGGHASAVHLGPDATFVRYKVRHGALLNCVAIVKSDVIARDSWSTPSTRAELAAHFDGWSPGLHAIIDRMPDGGLYKWPLFDRDPIDRWTVGRVTLLGDAAHPMLPFLGIGATMALEDAVMLGRSIAEADTPAHGLVLYERARIDRAAETTRASRRQGDILLGTQVAETFRRELPTSAVMDYDVRS